MPNIAHANTALHPVQDFFQQTLMLLPQLITSVMQPMAGLQSTDLMVPQL